MFALCQDGCFGDRWTLSGQSRVCLATQHTNSTEVQLSSWWDQPITLVLSSDHSLGYVPTSLGLRLPIVHIPWPSSSSPRLISISLAALLHTLAFPVRVFVIYLCTQAESVWRCNIVAFHINAMFTPWNTALSSDKFMCCISLTFHKQLTSSTAALSCSRDTLVPRKLASTQTSSSGPLTHHFPRTGSSWRTLAMTFYINIVKGTSITLSSQPFIISTADLLMNAAATLSHLTTGKCLTRFPQNENTLCRVRMCGALGTSFPYQRIAFSSNC